MNKNIENILRIIEKPSCYLGTEINRIKKDSADIELSIALGFPDIYEIGMSHLGIQILYNILNRCENIAAERFFAPGLDMFEHLKNSGISLFSLESQKPIKDFDIVGFSLLYELNYTNVLMMLDLAGIPFFAKDRDNSFPLIIAGGTTTVNPEPVADFFDAVVIGDGEQAVLKMASAFLNWKKKGKKHKTKLLEEWSKIKGVYIPCLLNDNSGVKIKKALIADINNAPFPESPIIPFGKPIHDRLRLELARGCSRGCRFCQAGMIYRPVRERNIKNILDICENAEKNTGYEEISLLSLSSGDYSHIHKLMQILMTRCQNNNTAVSFPSLRAGTLTSEIMEFIKKVRKTGFTIAPEAGTQRLRDVINKNISSRDIEQTVKSAIDAGWSVIKLYFMIGLPTETTEDLLAIADLAKNLRSFKGKKIQINAGISTFVPKAHTPFQWTPQISEDNALEKIELLKENLNIKGVNLKWNKPAVSMLEGLFARGDRHLSQLIVSAYKKGCIFDAWTELFKRQLWDKAIEETGICAADYISRNRSLEEKMPWDHIKTGVSREFLKKEWEKALKGEKTPDCRFGECAACGVCDFKKIKPCFSDKDSGLPCYALKEKVSGDFSQTFEIVYSKTGNARFFGHLETAKTFERALRRANIPIAYSEGFHPNPKISFKDALPVGLESENEKLYISLSENIEPFAVTEKLNKELPIGLVIKDCFPAPNKKNRFIPEPAFYKVRLKSGFFNQDKLANFNLKDTYSYKTTDKKGRLKTLDLKDFVSEIEITQPDTLQIVLKPANGRSIRPYEILSRVFSLSDKEIKFANTTKTLYS